MSRLGKTFSAVLVTASVGVPPVASAALGAVGEPDPAAAAKEQSCAESASKRESVVDQLEDNVGCFINRERTRRGLRPFRFNDHLAKAAAGHATDMVRHCYFAHTSPGGVTIGERVRRAGYLSGAKRWTAGETIAWLSPRDHPGRTVVRMWLDSPPHRDLLLSRELREVGLGIARGVPACPGKGLTFVADLGRRW
jgi:uncharacterized protein YkwD